MERIPKDLQSQRRTKPPGPLTKDSPDATPVPGLGRRGGVPAGALPGVLAAIQRSAGNAATSVFVQRHSLRDYPLPAPPEEQEAVQEEAEESADGAPVSRIAVQRGFGDKLRRFGRRIKNLFGAGGRHSAPPAQPPAQAPAPVPVSAPHPGPGPAPIQAPGPAAPGPAAAPVLAPPQAPSAAPANGQVPKKPLPPLPKLGPTTFSAANAVADGATTVKATVTAAGAGVTWAIEGEAYGATISPDGTITPGADLKGADQRSLLIRATDPRDPTRTSVGELPVISQAVAKATTDLAAFLTVIPKAIGFKTGLNGHFDLVYNPPAKLANVNVRVNFKFLDPALPGEKAEDKKKREDTYRDEYAKMVQKAWGKRYQFATTRQPESVWQVLNPVTVAVNITEDAANPHFTINVSAANQGAAYIQGPKAQMGTSLAPVAFANMPGFSAETDEINRLQKILPEVTFAQSSSEVPANRVAELTSAAHYLRRINVPKFELTAQGGTDAGGDAALGETRAKAVCAALQAPGIGVHTVKAAGGGPQGKVKVTPSIGAGFTNMQDVTAHEFGHMVGLDDEYPYQNEKRKQLTHYPLVKEAFGQEYADRTTRHDLSVTSASVMQSGNDVRIQHYVTFWEALASATSNAGAPVPPLARADWKFVE